MDKDDNPKSRGRQHRSNKKKYNKNKPAAHVPSSKSKTLAETNWDRYEQREEEENKLSSSTDFSVLADAPITQGSYFQFKSDKEDVDLDIAESVEASSLFNLDLTLLEKSLSTIPFHIRNGIDEEYFTESEIKIMTSLDDKVRDYQEYLKSYQSKDVDIIFSGSESEVSDHENEPDASIEQETQIDTIEPDPNSVKSDDAENLEQWLDDILDD